MTTLHVVILGRAYGKKEVQTSPWSIVKVFSSEDAALAFAAAIAARDGFVSPDKVGPGVVSRWVAKDHDEIKVETLAAELDDADTVDLAPLIAARLYHLLGEADPTTAVELSKELRQWYALDENAKRPPEEKK